jgi:hypothetical protein
MLRVEELGWSRTGCLASSAVCGLSADLPEEKRPWALGADATLRSFRANSSFPAAVAWSFAPLTASTLVVGTPGVSGGVDGTLPSL